MTQSHFHVIHSQLWKTWICTSSVLQISKSTQGSCLWFYSFKIFFFFFIYLQIVYKNLVIFYKWEQIFIKKVAILLKEEEKNEKKKGGPAALSFYGE